MEHIFFLISDKLHAYDISYRIKVQLKRLPWAMFHFPYVPLKNGTYILPRFDSLPAYDTNYQITVRFLVLLAHL